MKPLFLPLCAALLALSPALLAETIYVGGYTKPGGSQGIYRFDLDLESGKVNGGTLAAPSSSPSYLALHPSRKYLYAVNEAPGGGASAFAVQPDGSLKELNRESTLGDGPTHLCLDAEAKNILVANYNSGSVAVLPIQPDGQLGKALGFMQHKGSSINPKRQKGPHAHGVSIDKERARVLVADLGLDKVFIYQLDSEKGQLTAGEQPFASITPGAGPRHLAVAENGTAYVVNEMSNTVTVLTRDGQELKAAQTISTLPEGYTETSYTAEIALHPNGRFLYASNRGHDSIAISAVQEGGKLKAIGHTSTGGKNPRFFGIHPNGKLLLAANQASGNVLVLKLDPATGALTPSGHEFKSAEVSCVVFTGEAR